VVLDIGPADGRQIVNYTSSAIKAMYGVEPCTELHPGLKIAAERAGLGSKYHIVTCGAQPESLIPALTEAGLLKGKAEGVFDAIIACKVLCSVQNYEETTAGLYALLKPGGRMLICEHIKNPWRTPKGNLVARAIQEMFMIQGWSFFLGGCQLNRPTDQMLKNVANCDGGWKKMDLELVVQWGTIPFVIGELIKKD
jgi:Methyltransferase domain